MSAVTDTLIITQRQLRLLTRVPEVLIFSTIQPVMFVLLFRYVFGGSIDTGQPGGYVQLLMPGIFVQTVAFTLAGTASGLAEDMKKGLIDRFRSLPISQSALVIGRTLGDSLLNIVVLAVMGIAGYVVGWRPSSRTQSSLIAFDPFQSPCSRSHTAILSLNEPDSRCLLFVARPRLVTHLHRQSAQKNPFSLCGL